MYGIPALFVIDRSGKIAASLGCGQTSKAAITAAIDKALSLRALRTPALSGERSIALAPPGRRNLRRAAADDPVVPA